MLSQSSTAVVVCSIQRNNCHHSGLLPSIQLLKTRLSCWGLSAPSGMIFVCLTLLALGLMSLEAR